MQFGQGGDRRACSTKAHAGARGCVEHSGCQNDLVIALGRKNWLFAGSLRAGQRAAAIMSLLHTAKLNGHDPYQYLKDVLARLPTQPDSRLRELLSYCWKPGSTA